jgi:hypothetical protein
MTSAETKGDHDYNVRVITHTGGALSVAPVAMTIPFMTEELYRAMRPAELEEIRRTGRAGLSTILDPRRQPFKWITGSRKYAVEHASDMARDTMIVRYDVSKDYWRRTISTCSLDGWDPAAVRSWIVRSALVESLTEVDVDKHSFAQLARRGEPYKHSNFIRNPSTTRMNFGLDEAKRQVGSRQCEVKSAELMSMKSITIGV